MRIALVGGTGFIGTSLASGLVRKGHTVTVIGRRCGGPRHSAAQSLVWDASSEWKGAIPDFEMIVHLASANGDRDLESLDTYLNNVAVTRNIVQLASRIDGCAMLYVSTVQVYGVWKGTISSQAPIKPRTDYGFSHWVAEQQVEMFGRVHQRQTLITRLSNVIGVSESKDAVRWDTVPAVFCRQAVRDHQVVVNSDPHQHRDFVGVSVVIDTLLALIEDVGAWDGSRLLVASGASTSIGSVALMVAEIASRRIGTEVPVTFRAKADNSLGQRLHILQKDWKSHRLVGSSKVAVLPVAINDLLSVILS